MAPKSAPAPPPPQAAPPPQPLLAKQETADVISAGAQQPAGEKDKIAQSNPPATVQSPPQGFAQEEKTSRGAMKSSGAGAVSSNRFGAMARAASARRDMPAGPGFLWTIASSQQRGIVQRSRDGGATWETVPLNDQISFRAVVSTGSDVWAGGSAGALFHSTDAGIHWERVPIDATGSILEIRTRNGAEVAVTTDAHERWLSEDNGRTWQLTDTPR
jgi:hypothetical protein